MEVGYQTFQVDDFSIDFKFFLEQVKKILKIEFNDECTYQCRHLLAKNLDSHDILICRLYIQK